MQAEGEGTIASQEEEGDSLDESSLPLTVAAATATQRRDLEAKIVREMCRDLGNGKSPRANRTACSAGLIPFLFPGTFFYSYDTDISRSLQHKHKQLDVRNQSKGLLTTLLSNSAAPDASSSTSPPQAEPESGSAQGIAGTAWVEPDQHLPLWKRFDSRFLWNASLMKDFLDGGLHDWVLPIMQGWVQSTRFHIPPTQADQDAYKSRHPSVRTSLDSAMLPPSTPVDLVVISRRSKDRAGLRFQRRGIDQGGNVANFVETEQIIRIKVRFVRHRPD